MKLGRREKIMLFVGAPILCLVVLYYFVFGPPLDELRRLNSALADQEKDLRDAENIVMEQAKLEAEILELKKNLEARGGAFDLFDFIGSTVTRLKMAKRTKMKLVPQRVKSEFDYEPSVVTVTLEGVSLKELTGFLYRIHAVAKLLTVDRIEISAPSSGKGGLQVEMTISTLVSARRVRSAAGTSP